MEKECGLANAKNACACPLRLKLRSWKGFSFWRSQTIDITALRIRTEYFFVTQLLLLLRTIFEYPFPASSFAGRTRENKIPVCSNMSTASKVTLLSTILGTAGIVAFVHWAQTAEQAVCHLI